MHILCTSLRVVHVEYTVRGRDITYLGGGGIRITVVWENSDAREASQSWLSLDTEKLGNRRDMNESVHKVSNNL